jgi:hypothetical protein
MIRKFEKNLPRFGLRYSGDARIFKSSDPRIVKHVVYFLAIVALFISGCANGGWRVVDGGEFTVEFPGAPIDTATAVGDAAGAKLYFIPVDNGIDSNIYYAVSVYTLDDSAEIMGDLLDEIMLKDAEIYAWSMGAFLSDSGKVVKSGKYSGYEYSVFLAQNSGILKMRKFAKGKHLYTLVVITGNEYLENKDIYKFLDSFKLK